MLFPSGLTVKLEPGGSEISRSQRSASLQSNPGLGVARILVLFLSITPIFGSSKPRFALSDPSCIPKVEYPNTPGACSHVDLHSTSVPHQDLVVFAVDGSVMNRWRQCERQRGISVQETGKEALPDPHAKATSPGNAKLREARAPRHSRRGADATSPQPRSLGVFL